MSERFVEGPSLKSVKVERIEYSCPKHGVLEKPFQVSYSEKSGDSLIHHDHVYCPACFTELLDWAQSQGLMKKITKKIITK